MTEQSPSRLGPLLFGTVLCPSLDEALSAYRDCFEMQPQAPQEITAEVAGAWGLPALAGARSAVLRAASDVPWLRLVESTEAAPAAPFCKRGWMSLEIAVADVDALAQRLDGSPFEVVGAPANLDLSPNIRAAQVVGPGGEVLYLTEIKGEVPPFQLPQAVCAVDRLFVGVLNAGDLDASVAWYSQLAAVSGMRADTVLGAANRMRGYEAGRRHPLAVFQLSGESLLEIDSLPPWEQDQGAADGGLQYGIMHLTLAATSLAELPFGSAVTTTLAPPPYTGRLALFCRGPDGEGVELLECS